MSSKENKHIGVGRKATTEIEWGAEEKMALGRHEETYCSGESRG